MILVEQLTAKLEVMPSVAPAQPIPELPDVVIEALVCSADPKLLTAVLVKLSASKPGRDRRIAVPNAQRVAKLPNAGCPGGATIQHDVAPTNAGIVHQIVSDRASPVANRVVNRRR